jgi:cytochrome P450
MAFTDTITVADLEADPFPIYATLRQTTPVAYVAAANVWFATRWEDVETVTKSPELFTSEAPTSPVELSFGKPTILTSEGETHSALREGIEPHYRPRKVAEYIEALVRPIAEQHLSHFKGRSEAELMAEYFEPISVLSLARSFGLGDASVPQLRNWFHGLSQGAINYERDPERQKISDATCAEVDAAILPILHKLREKPENSPLSHMLHSGMPEGQSRDAAFILPSVKVTLLGGMQEPGHGAGTVLTGLLQNPDQYEAVRDDKAKYLTLAVDEGLRWVAPIGTQMRLSKVDVELGGTFIPAGQPVAAVLASANRDESRFENADAFDIFRNKSNHASFGFGNHFCAGKWFAKSQIEIALSVLLEHIPHMKLNALQPIAFRGWEFRAPTALHVTF